MVALRGSGVRMCATVVGAREGVRSSHVGRWGGVQGALDARVGPGGRGPWRSDAGVEVRDRTSIVLSISPPEIWRGVQAMAAPAPPAASCPPEVHGSGVGAHVRGDADEVRVRRHTCGQRSSAAIQGALQVMDRG